MRLTKILKHTVTVLTLTAFFMCTPLSFAATGSPYTDLATLEQAEVLLDTDTEESMEEVLAVPETTVFTETPSAENTSPPQEAQTTSKTKHMLLTLGSQDAILDEATVKMEISPEVVEGTTFLPMRFVAEKVLEAAVQWDPETKTISITKDDTSVTLLMNTGDAYLNGQAVPIAKPPFIKEGRTLVPLRFLAESFKMQIDYDATTKQINITKTTNMTPTIANQPPVITSLGLQQGSVLKIGETPEYGYTYHSESNAAITNEEWTCRYVGDTQTMTSLPRAFFRSGEYILSLRIQDTAGNWSSTTEERFTVSHDVLVSEMLFKFNNPLYGETFENIDNINFLYHTSNEDTTITKSGPTLHLSNSPEVVTKHGILYRSVAQDNFRLFYHHLNGTSDKQYLYIVAENNELTPVTLQTLKSGVGGPGPDYMNLGQVVAMRYLESTRSGTQVLQPGEKVILNAGLQALNKDEAVTGMQDYQVDGSITISVIMGPEKTPQTTYVPETTIEDPFGEAVSLTTEGNQTNGENGATTTEPVEPEKTPEEILREKIEYLISLPVLPSTKSQVRGVFENADYQVIIKSEGGMEKVQLGNENPGFDSWQVGKEPFTGEEMKNVGNYGVVYSINITSSTKTGVLLNPRGGIFKGAFMGQDGGIYKAPNTGFFTGKQQRATILGILEANKSTGFIYTPPSGSDTPVILALIGEDHWE